jgi:pyruvate,orthophosphate dikinase
LPDAPRSGITTEDDVLRALLIKGVVPVDQLAVTVASDLEPVSALVGQLGTDGLVEAASGGLRLTSEGKLKALAVFDADREKIGEDRLHELLLAFHGLDLRTKDTVTAWQLRASGDEPVINDHSDAAYDTEVLRRLSALHDNAVAWITPLTIAFTRFVRYQGRLEQALISAREGDQRYVASPRVDSYHSVWFELHEDLIRIAGQRRSDQAAIDGA